jgi:prevent-host-death family protein
MNVNVSEAKAHLGRYVSQAAKGKRFVICDRNRPVAELRGLSDNTPSAKPLKLGLLKGQFNVPVTFNDPLDDFEQAFYGEPPS